MQVKVTDGKIFFKLSGDQDEAQKVLQLKTAERAFVQVCHIKTDNLGKPYFFNFYINRRTDKISIW